MHCIHLGKGGGRCRCQAVVRWLSGGGQAVARWLPGGCQVMREERQRVCTRFKLDHLEGGSIQAASSVRWQAVRCVGQKHRSLQGATRTGRGGKQGEAAEVCVEEVGESWRGQYHREIHSRDRASHLGTSVGRWVGRSVPGVQGFSYKYGRACSRTQKITALPPPPC